MELKLVYRGLRQISDSVLHFYSHIDVDGEENVPKDGPLILTSCHHNEILDIATLSVTIPHGRPVCFWTKSTMFKNPLVRAILLSSGSIPVARNPNSTPGPAERSDTAAPQSGVNEALFRETFKALEGEEVIGVFPEGTSYTEPSIAQVKDGASRAALEYVRWRRETKGKEKAVKSLKVVPVGIVYTDKSQYQSRICVRWGEPIDVEAFMDERDPKPESANSRELIKALTAEIEKRMLKLTINAPDWDTLYAAQMTRDILWADEKIPAAEFVQISQNLVDLFADPNAAPSVVKARQALLHYHSLLYYTDISHDSLNAILPSLPVTQISRTRALFVLVRQLVVAVFHPRFLLFNFTGALALHIPAYAFGLLADRLFGKPDEPETRAQFKAVFGGLAAAASYGMLVHRIFRSLATASYSITGELHRDGFVEEFSWTNMSSARGDGLFWKLKTAIGIFGMFYVTSFVFSRWHNYWVGSNYRQLKRFLASVKLFLGIMAPKSSNLTGVKLTPYTTPYIPPPNPFIKRREGTSEPKDKLSAPRAPSVLPHRLIHPLLAARAEATQSMWSFLVDSKYLHGLVSAKARGEAWMQVGPTKRLD